MYQKNNFDLPIDLYRLGTVLFTNNDTNIEVEQVQRNELLYINSSPLTSPTNRRPIYVRIAEFSIAVFPATISGNVFCNYINRPADVQWGYNVVNKKALYNAGTSVNFELHASEEQELVMKILELAGITIRQADLVQVAGQEDLQKIQQEKAYFLKQKKRRMYLFTPSIEETQPEPDKPDKLKELKILMRERIKMMDDQN